MVGICLGLAFVGGVAFGWYGIGIATLAALLLTLTRRVSVAVTLAIAIVSLLGDVRAVPAPSLESPKWVDDVRAVRGVVDSGPISTGHGQRFNVRVNEVRVDSEWQVGEGELCVSAPFVPEVRRGDRLFLSATVQSLAELPPGVAKAFAARGCQASGFARTIDVTGQGHGLLHAADRRRQRMVRQFLRIAPGDTGALMAGLVTGDDGALSDEARNRFVTTGTTHITAVSGSNIALFVVAIVSLGGHLGLQRRTAWLVATVIVVWGYAFLVGMEPPALRAAMVAMGAVFAVLVGRRPDLVTLTVLAAALQLIVRPEDYWTVSFRLSFVAALALALVLRGVHSDGLSGWFRHAVVGTVAAQIATTPVLLAYFGRVSPYALPTNLLIAPVVTIAFPSALAASFLGSFVEPLGEAVGTSAAPFSAVILWIVTWMAGRPGAQMSGGKLNWFEIAVISIVCGVFVAALSADGRRTVRLGWRWVRSEPRSAMAIGTFTGFGCLVGLIIGAMR